MWLISYLSSKHIIDKINNLVSKLQKMIRWKFEYFKSCHENGEPSPLTASQNPISSGVGADRRGRTVAPIDLARRRMSHFEVKRTTIKPFF